MIKIQKRLSGEKRRVGFYLIKGVHDGLRAASKERGVSMSEIVSLVLHEWLVDAGYLDAPTELESE
jgi:hypothetical protein